MTKVTILGEEKPQKEAKKIEFRYYLSPTSQIEPSTMKPGEYENIELITRDYSSVNGINYDLMFAYDGSRANGILYLGQFNDGVV